MILFLLKLRTNFMVRLILFPFIKMKKKLDLVRYRKSEHSQYIKKLKSKYKGERCFIIGNGPSLSAQDLDLLVNEKTFGFNRIYDIYSDTKWRPQFYMVTDKNLINVMNEENIKNLSGSEIFVNDRKTADKYKNQINIHQIMLWGKYFIRREKMTIEKVSEDVSKYFSPAHTVIISALELAFFMGFKEIYLLGMDFNFAVTVDMDGTKRINNTVVPHFEQMKDRTQYPAYQEAMIRCLETCRQYAKAHGIKIYNATRGGKLEVFERISLETVLNSGL